MRSEAVYNGQDNYLEGNRISDANLTLSYLMFLSRRAFSEEKELWLKGNRYLSTLSKNSGELGVALWLKGNRYLSTL